MRHSSRSRAPRLAVAAQSRFAELVGPLNPPHGLHMLSESEWEMPQHEIDCGEGSVLLSESSILSSLAAPLTSSPLDLRQYS